MSNCNCTSSYYHRMTLYVVFGTQVPGDGSYVQQFIGTIEVTRRECQGLWSHVLEKGDDSPLYTEQSSIVPICKQRYKADLWHSRGEASELSNGCPKCQKTKNGVILCA